MIDLTNKRGLILGMANSRSIATSIADTLHSLGAEMAFTYMPDPKNRFQSFVEKQAEKYNSQLVFEVNVEKDEDITGCFQGLKKAWGGIDFVVHSVAFADRSDLEQGFSLTSREGFRKALDISAYSLVSVANQAKPLFLSQGGGSLLALTFIGSMLAVPNYNVMGPSKAALEANVRYLARELGPDNIRCNALSSGAIRTLSSSGVKQFAKMLQIAGEHAALKRNVTLQEVANAAAFLLSPTSSGMTGQTLYVDCGYNIMAN